VFRYIFLSKFKPKLCIGCTTLETDEVAGCFDTVADIANLMHESVMKLSVKTIILLDVHSLEGRILPPHAADG